MHRRRCYAQRVDQSQKPELAPDDGHHVNAGGNANPEQLTNNAPVRFEHSPSNFQTVATAKNQNERNDGADNKSACRAQRDAGKPEVGQPENAGCQTPRNENVDRVDGDHDPQSASHVARSAQRRRSDRGYHHKRNGRQNDPKVLCRQRARLAFQMKPGDNLRIKEKPNPQR